PENLIRFPCPVRFRFDRRDLERPAGPATAVSLDSFFRTDPRDEPFGDDHFTRVLAGEMMACEKFFEPRGVFNGLRRSTDEGAAGAPLEPYVILEAEIRQDVSDAFDALQFSDGVVIQLARRGR